MRTFISLPEYLWLGTARPWMGRSVSKAVILSFNSISVIGFTIRNAACDGRDPIPRATLLDVILLLILFALLIQRRHLVHAIGLLCLI